MLQMYRVSRFDLLCSDMICFAVLFLARIFYCTICNALIRFDTFSNRLDLLCFAILCCVLFFAAFCHAVMCLASLRFALPCSFMPPKNARGARDRSTTRQTRGASAAAAAAAIPAAASAADLAAVSAAVQVTLEAEEGGTGGENIISKLNNKNKRLFQETLTTHSG